LRCWCSWRWPEIFVGDHPGGEAITDHGMGRKAAGFDHLNDLCRGVKGAVHQHQAFSQGYELHHSKANIRLFDDQPAAGA